jgi:two-component system alkaline phosphatase synthesis response regulator PhoP
MEMRPKILLIDDDVDFVAATRTVLESKNYKVVVAYEGQAGLVKAREEKPDLVLLDIIMPVKNGFTAAEQFKKDPALSKIPVIMLTSFSTKGQGSGIPVSRGYTLEAEDYVEKPISPSELLAKVQQYLGEKGP